MYDEMTTADLIVVAYDIAHPSDNPKAENADLIDELASRLLKLSIRASKSQTEVDTDLN
jgi:hypothetical protein